LLPKSRDKVAIGIVATVLAAVIGGALYFFLPDTLVIGDLSRAGTYRLTTTAESAGIYQLSVTGHGDFEGSVKLELVGYMWNSKISKDELQPVREVTLENGGSFEWTTDWYSSHAFIRVTPGTARAGEVTVRYRFVEFL
jgi:hypothetical protein